MRASIVLLLGLLIPIAAWCQQESGQLNPRQLFYRDRSEHPDADNVPPLTKEKVSPETKTSTTTRANSGGQKVASTKGNPPPVATTSSSKNQPNVAQPTANQSSTATIPAVQHLGLRYNVLLVNNRGGAEATDPDRNFLSGECIALEFESNRSGYLAIVEQGSSGKWEPLFPSAQLPDESDIVRAGSVLRVPRTDCFEIVSVPGVERVFVVLSRNPGDVYDLIEAIKKNNAGDTEPTDRRAPNTGKAAVTNQAMLDDKVAHMRDVMLASRDLKLRKFPKPEGAGERPNAVYVVNVSQTDADRVVTEISIKHR